MSTLRINREWREPLLRRLERLNQTYALQAREAAGRVTALALQDILELENDLQHLYVLDLERTDSSYERGSPVDFDAARDIFDGKLARYEILAGLRAAGAGSGTL